ncbi:hypothetical protein [Saccharibacillus deserti]|uniref:hypothetical protein n=1 Tax=Saccharibacillus deserti TaxID=1634444 RepID=UPI0015532180|nr:hypothetical protein [Saccharibacillus deserti]
MTHDEQEERRDHQSPDPTDDETTNLRDDGSMQERKVEAETSEDERPDAHAGNVPGQVDPRMAQAAAEIKEEHADAEAPAAIDEPGLDRLSREQKAEHTDQ